MRKPAKKQPKPGTAPASRKVVPAKKSPVKAKAGATRQKSPTPPESPKKAVAPKKTAAAKQPETPRPVWRIAASVEMSQAPQAPESARTQDATPAIKPLTIAEERFAAAYFEHLNATKAYKSVHPTATDGTARSEGARFLAKPSVQAAVAELRNQAQTRTGITVDRLVNMLGDMALAEESEISAWHIGCCRYCHGIDFLRQRTDREYERDRREFDAGLVRKPRRRKGQSEAEYQDALRKTIEWDESGGPGFDGRREPNEECPECMGEGYGRMVVRDTRKLGPRERLLYAGMKQTEKGFEAKVHDKLAAVEKLMRHLGGYERDNKQKGGDLAEWLGSMSRAAALPVVQTPPDDDLGGGAA